VRLCISDINKSAFDHESLGRENKLPSRYLRQARQLEAPLQRAALRYQRARPM
jgi:hypothetical protein